jgi:hypothetical protein
MFRTQTNGADKAKSPIGMFDSVEIDNDLKYVDTKIREYYELPPNDGGEKTQTQNQNKGA